MDSNIEHIIKNYQYFELNEAQKKLISEWAENSDEFEALQSTLLATDQFVEVQKEDINPVVKQRLDVRFAEKHNQTRLTWYNKLWFFLWPRESPIYKRPLIHFASICLIVVISIQLFPDVKKQQLAMNDVKTNEKQEVEEVLDSKPENKSNIESNVERSDESAKAEQERVIKDEIELKNIRKSEDRLADKSAETLNNQGWELTEQQAPSAADRRSISVEEVADDQPLALKDKERRDMDYDKSDITVNALEQVNVDRLASVNKEYKKVSSVETLDLLTALY
jgi:hypothetical protein